jgi:ABC-type multidrug transport system ATPase subunit
MTVIRNVMVGLANQTEYKCNLFESIFRLPRHFQTEKAMRQKAKELLSIFGLEEERNNLACNLPYGKQRKLEIARALATNPKLLLLDERTSGLDPVVRDEVVDMFYDFTRDENHSILISSHIVSDLEKLCDYVAFLHKGKLLLCAEKDELLSEYGIIHCTVEQLSELDEKVIKYKKETPYGAEVIVPRKDALVNINHKSFR